MNITIEFNIFQLAHLPNFIWKRSSIQNRTNKHNLRIQHIRMGYVPTFILNRNFWYFWSKFARRNYFLTKTEKSEYHYSIQHIPLGLLTKFHLKQIILSFWNKFVQKGYFCFEPEKQSSPTNSAYSKLAWMPNFILNRLFWSLWPNLCKKCRQIFKMNTGFKYCLVIMKCSY